MTSLDIQLAVQEIPERERPKNTILRYRIVVVDETGKPLQVVRCTLSSSREICEKRLAELEACPRCLSMYVLEQKDLPHAGSPQCRTGRTHCDCRMCVKGSYDD